MRGVAGLDGCDFLVVGGLFASLTVAYGAHAIGVVLTPPRRVRGVHLTEPNLVHGPGCTHLPVAFVWP